MQGNPKLCTNADGLRSTFSVLEAADHCGDGFQIRSETLVLGCVDQAGTPRDFKQGNALLNRTAFCTLSRLSHWWFGPRPSKRRRLDNP